MDGGVSLGRRLMRFGRTRHVYLLLLVMIFVGAAVRLHVALKYGLALDEFFAWQYGMDYATSESLWAAMRSVAAVDAHPPGYYLLMCGVVQTLGESEIALRAPSILATLAAVIAVFSLGRRLFGETEGLIAAALMAVAWYPTIWGVYAKAYGLLVLASLVIGELWFVVAGAMRGGKPVPYGALAGYAVVSTILGSLHYFGLMLVALFGTGLLLVAASAPERRGRHLLEAVLVHVPVTAGFALWVPMLLGYMKHAVASEVGYLGYGASVSGPGAVVSFIAKTVVWFFTGNSRYGAVFTVTAMGATGIPIAVRLVRHRRNENPDNDDRNAVVFLGAWIVLQIVAGIVMSAAVTPILTYRNLGVIVGPTFILAARGITACCLRRRLAVGVAVAVVLLNAGFVIGNLDRDGLCVHAVREVSNEVREISRQYPDVSLVGGKYSTVFRYYESLIALPTSTCGLGSDMRERRFARSETEILDCIRQVETTYFWYLFGPSASAASVAVLDRNADRIRSIQRYGASAYLYRKRQP